MKISPALASIIIGLACFSHGSAATFPSGSPSPVPTPVPTQAPTPVPQSVTAQELRMMMNHQLDPTRADRESLTVPEGTTQQAVSSLGRTEGTHAGVTMAPVCAG